MAALAAAVVLWRPRGPSDRISLASSLGMSEEAREFIAQFPTNDNETWLKFARRWAENRTLAEAAYKLFGGISEGHL